MNDKHEKKNPGDHGSIEETKQVVNKAKEEIKDWIDDSKETAMRVVSDEEVRKAVDKINPDRNSMESRG